MRKTIFIIAAALLLTSCVVYTEKRSEALSQAVFATAEGIKNARFEKASQYAEQAKRLAYAPKTPIQVPPIITPTTKKITSVNTAVPIRSSTNKPTINSSVITSTTETQEEETVLRLVVPEFLKHAKLLIENSEEWNELLKTKEFKEFLEKDNERLKKLVKDIDDELAKQQKYNTKMVEDLNKLQKEVLQKRLHIIKLYIVITILLGVIGGGVYLRMKGIL